MRSRRPVLLLAAAPLALLAAACSGGGDPTPGLTADDDRQLNDAAAMLDANSVALEDVSTDGNQQQP
ncbi:MULTISPECIES: hypothetical protein [Sphingomonas]|jgi:hypothetical protein|uniref:Uncharacterized protein n=1 Tax=Sphingomonas ginsenosidimutans TaxID=862134 RepID=A0A2A4I2P6_9SPHN|nr:MULTISPECIES: hypothetical protein [Sphingomonas]MBY0300514.1 hypothetical protein [Sphingomonas ginsenosidimutans]PCG10890.1 hypothetical protein COA17_02025 [Sphingomonas ginsenosidimutans]